MFVKIIIIVTIILLCQCFVYVFAAIFFMNLSFHKAFVRRMLQNN